MLDANIAPGPRGDVGAAYVADALRALTQWHDEYGDIARFELGGATCHALYAPEYVQHVLQDAHANYLRETQFYQSLRSMIGNGLLSSSGTFWLRQRRIVQPHFAKSMLPRFGQVMTECGEWLAERWESVAASGKPFDLAPEFTALTLRVLGLSLFGGDLSGSANELSLAIGDFSRQTAKRGTLIAYASFAPDSAENAELLRAKNVIQGLAHGLIEDRRRDESVHDLLSVLMRSRDAVTGELMSDDELAAEVMHLVTAGHETTSSAFCYTFYLLTQHPEVVRHLREELATVLGGRSPTLEDFGKLVYTRAIVQEALRLYPPVAAQTRLCMEDDVIGDYLIPGGTLVVAPAWVVQRRRDLWGPDADRFDPRRFLDDHVERHRFAYFPFSPGAHQCIGMHFALLELVICTAILVQRFDVAMTPGGDAEVMAGVSLRPKHGIWVDIRTV